MAFMIGVVSIVLSELKVLLQHTDYCPVLSMNERYPFLQSSDSTVRILKEMNREKERTGLMPGVRHRSMGSSFRSGSISDSAPGPAFATTALPLPLLCRRRPCSSCCGCATFILSCFTAPWGRRAPAAADGDAEMPDTTLLLLIISLQAMSLALCSLLHTTGPCTYIARCKETETHWIMLLDM